MARFVMMLVPSALRRRLEIREVEPEIVSPGDQKPWVLQMLAEGQLPGVNAEPLLRAVEPAPEEVPEGEEEKPAEPPVVEVVPTLVEVDLEPEGKADPLAEAVPTLVEVDPEPEREPEPEPVAEAVEPVPEPRAEPAPPKPARKRARTKHRPVKRVAPPQRAAAHAPAPVDVEPPQQQADDVETVACEIRVWRGYRKANFFACVFSDDGEPLAVAESPSFRAHGNGVPEKTADAIAAHEQLRAQLEAAGWQYAASGRTWFGDLYSRPL